MHAAKTTMLIQNTAGCILANVTRSLYAVARPSVVCLSVVCNARSPYSVRWNFRQFFCGIWYLGHPSENF